MDHRRQCRRLTHASSSPMPSTRSAARAMRGSVDQRRALTWHGGSQHDTTAEVSASSRGPARHTDAKSTTSILPDQQRSRSTRIPREQQIGITSICVPVTNKDGEKTSTSGRTKGVVRRRTEAERPRCLLFLLIQLRPPAHKTVAGIFGKRRPDPSDNRAAHCLSAAGASTPLSQRAAL